MKKGSQNNSIGLSTKVKGLLQDQLDHEKLCVDKYTEYAAKAKDPQLRQLFTEIASCEQKHYDSIQSMLNGTIPDMNSNASGSGSGSSGSNYSSSTMGGNNQNSSQQFGSSRGNLTADVSNQPETAQNPILGTDNIFDGYTGGGGFGSYVNQADGTMYASSIENTLESGDLIGGGIAYGSYGATTGGPSYQSTNSPGGSYGTGARSQNTSNSGGSSNSSNSVTDCDKNMCTDMLMTEKHISKNYDTTIFECTNTQMRNVLNHIQKEEQEHGDKIYNFMSQKGWYPTN